MLFASSCSCASLRGPHRLGVGEGSGRVSMVSCNASSPPPTPASSPVESDYNTEECAPEMEPTVYVAENAISSGASGTSAEESENTVAVTAGIALFSIATASAVLLQVGKNQPQVQGPDYSGPSLSYYITKFKPAQQTVEASVAAPALQSSLSVEASFPTETSGSSSTVEASAPPGVQLLLSSAQVEAGGSH